MEQIYVLGKCTNPKMVSVNRLSSQVAGSSHPIQIYTIMKKESEWPEYIRQICSMYGFYQKEHFDILCFRQDGVLIGDFPDFENYCREKWGICLQPSSPEEESKGVEVNKIIKAHEDEEEEISDLERSLILKKSQSNIRVSDFEKIISPKGRTLRIKVSSKVLAKNCQSKSQSVDRVLEDVFNKMTTKVDPLNISKSEMNKAKENKKMPKERKSIFMIYEIKNESKKGEKTGDGKEEFKKMQEKNNFLQLNQALDISDLDNLRMTNIRGRLRLTF